MNIYVLRTDAVISAWSDIPDPFKAAAECYELHRNSLF